MDAGLTVSNAHAAPTTIVSGRGSGTFTCGDGTEFSGVVLNLNIQKQKGKGQTFKLSGPGI